MFSFKLLSIALAVCHAFDVTLPDGQTVLDIDIHIGSGSKSINTMGDGSPTTNAVPAQYPSGVVVATDLPQGQGFLFGGVGKNSRAYITQWNSSTWQPSYKGSYDLGGNFNRSLAIHRQNEVIYFTGTSMGGNLVLKRYWNAGQVYPKTYSWIFVEEGTLGTPAINSQDDNLIDLVVKKTDGNLIHKRYNPSTDEITDVAVPAKSFDSNPALLKYDGYLTVFARDTAGKLWYSQQGDDLKWSAWGDLGGNFVGDPATKSSGCKADVYIIAKDGSVFNRYFQESGQISDWLSIKDTKAKGTGAVHYYGPRLDRSLFYYQTESNIQWVRRQGDKLIYSGVADGVTAAAPAVFYTDYQGTRYSDVIVMGMGGDIYRRQRSLAAGWQGGYVSFGWNLKL